MPGLKLVHNTSGSRYEARGGEVVAGLDGCQPTGAHIVSTRTAVGSACEGAVSQIAKHALGSAAKD